MELLSESWVYIYLHAAFLQRDLISRPLFHFNFWSVSSLYLTKSRANHAKRHHLGTFFKKCMVASPAKSAQKVYFTDCNFTEGDGTFFIYLSGA